MIHVRFCYSTPQNDKSTNSVKVIGGDELSSLTGKVLYRYVM